MLLYGCSAELVFVDLLRCPRIDSQPGGPVRQPYFSFRPDRLYRLAKSIPRNRFLGSINVYKYGLCWKKVRMASHLYLYTGIIWGLIKRTKSPKLSAVRRKSTWKDIHFVVPNLGPPSFAPSQTERTFLFSLVTIQPFKVFLAVYIGHFSYFTNIFVLKSLPVPPPHSPKANIQFKFTKCVPFLLGCR